MAGLLIPFLGISATIALSTIRIGSPGLIGLPLAALRGVGAAGERAAA